ncbi:MAG: CRISPR-associated helicase Cas3' [Armatimonadia bacterium]
MNRTTITTNSPSFALPPDLLLAPWAKLSPCRPNEYHPLLCHLLDTAAVMHALWHHALPQPKRRLLATLLGVSDHDACRWLTLLAALHDIGKAAPGFQAKSPLHRRRLQRLGLQFPLAADANHVQTGMAALKSLLSALTVSPAVAVALATALGGHHGHTPARRRCGERSLGDAHWQGLRTALGHTLAAHVGLESRSLPPGLTAGNQPLLVLIAALARLADWLASDTDHFPVAPSVASITEYADTAAAQAGGIVRAMDWMQVAAQNADFADLFGFDPNPMQRLVGLAAGDLTAPALVILEAPTGSGKTEAALHLARSWDAAGHQSGYYVALPTQATATALHDRLQSYSPHESVNLIHAAAPGAGVTRLLSPAGVGTLDQSLLAVANDRQPWVRLLGLANKTVIIDEVHACDAYTTGLLTRLLEWLAALNCSVIILSATLPEAQRASLLKAWRKAAVPLASAAYPRVTISTSDGTQCCELPIENRRQVALRPLEDDPMALADHLRDRLADGGCGAVICNTVARAQQLYVHLRGLLQQYGIPVELYHARYPASERCRREHGVIAGFGKDRSFRPHRAVLVATQVVEQSLDLDFDLMVSELAPIDLLVQRAGRLHRHPHPRPAALATPELALLTPARDTSGQPVFGATEHVYHPHLLLRTWLLLQGRAALNLPEDTAALVESVYGDAAKGDHHCSPRLAGTAASLAAETALQTHTAAAAAIPGPECAATLCGGQQAPVRWQDAPTLEVICLDGTLSACRLGDRQLDLSTEPPAPVIHSLRREAFRVTGRVCADLRRLPRPDWWNHSAHLHGLVPVFLNADHTTTTTEHIVQLDPDLGFTITATGCDS